MPYLLSAQFYNPSTKSWTSTLDCPPLTMVTPQQPSRYSTLVNDVYY